jgi:hypothetical protein
MAGRNEGGARMTYEKQRGMTNDRYREPPPRPGYEDGHIACGCWKTGIFLQVPCPWHDGNGRYPLGAWKAEQQRKGL